MAEKSNKNLFQRLTQLFRSGPVIRRKVKNYSEPTASSAYEMFRRNQSDIYSSTVAAYGAFDPRTNEGRSCIYTLRIEG